MKSFIETNSIPVVSPDKPSLSSRIRLAIESEQILQDIESNQADDLRALETVQCLEDLHITIGRLKKSDQTDQAIVQNVSAIAVSGTGVSVEEFLEHVANSKGLAQVSSTRIDNTLYQYVLSIPEQLGRLAKYVQITNERLAYVYTVLSEARSKVNDLKVQSEDLPRSAKFRVISSKYLATKEGVCKTQADLLKELISTAEDFSALTKVSNLVGSKLLSAIRSVMPSSEINSAEDYMGAVTAASNELYTTTASLWTDMVVKSSLELSKDSSGLTVAKTKPMLGNIVFGLALDTDKIQNGLGVSAQSEIIRSFEYLSHSVNPEIIEGEFVCIDNCTYQGTLKLIDELQTIIESAQELINWYSVTTCTAQMQFEQDLINLKRFFNPQALEVVDAPTKENYQRFLTDHITNVNHVLSLTIDLIAKPLTHLRELVDNAQITIHAMVET